ncbi:TRAF-type zinc finger domain-containing protein 1-like isoform X2 [Harmonia axyridis]|nr:TRAF-type zinc finger domain-containing protein 1-like isoform X2 [Harmonia axyridis]XP_045468756.1 TRAF-type zinc finger domain-containing protein 1-like isoform X2 [Harmonia axyridis]
MAEVVVEHELCGNCKREIPQSNYVMHSAHCARNITLCKTCKEPIAKAKYEDHVKTCFEKIKPQPKQKTPEPPKSNIEKSPYYQSRKEVQDKKIAERKEKYLERHEKFSGNSRKLGSQLQSTSLSEGHNYISSTNMQSTKLQSSNVHESKSIDTTSKITSNGTGAVKKVEKKINGNISKPNSGMMPCRYCELELPKVELEEHENYCGSRTDKCLECGELVMFKHKQMHLDTNHGFLKLNDEPGPKPSWDSTTQKTNSPPRRRRFEPTIYTDFSQFDPTDYLPSNYRIPKAKIEKGESYKEISRRLDCKTEYIRNLLHDSASITVPLRHSGAVPRNHFNHNKGQAPQPPSRRRNPPTELTIPCEFCDTPIPHMDLIQHQTGCRPDLFFSRSTSRVRSFEDDEDGLARAPSPLGESRKTDIPRVPRRQRQSKKDLLIPCEFCDTPIPEDILIQHQTGCRPDLAQFQVPSTTASCPEVDLPCEFCADMFPASQLNRHQATCG